MRLKTCTIHQKDKSITNSPRRPVVSLRPGTQVNDSVAQIKRNPLLPWPFASFPPEQNEIHLTLTKNKTTQNHSTTKVRQKPRRPIVSSRLHPPCVSSRPSCEMIRGRNCGRGKQMVFSIKRVVLRLPCVSLQPVCNIAINQSYVTASQTISTTPRQPFSSLRLHPLCASSQPHPPCVSLRLRLPCVSSRPV
jgi:hypothetical protein